MDPVVSSVLLLCGIQHVQQDWLDQCLAYLHDTNELIQSALNTQIIHADLEDVIQQSDLNFTQKDTVICKSKYGFIVQIMELREIGHSNQTMLDALSNSEYKSVLPRKMIRYLFSDGVKTISAIEMEIIPSLSIETPLGAKVIINNVVIRNGIMLLKPNNVSRVDGSIISMNDVPVRVRLEQEIKERVKNYEPLGGNEILPRYQAPINRVPIINGEGIQDLNSFKKVSSTQQISAMNQQKSVPIYINEDDYDFEDYNNGLEGFDFTILDRVSELEPKEPIIKQDLYEFEKDFEKDFDYSLLDQYAETHSKTDTCIRISDIYQSNIGQTVNIKTALDHVSELEPKEPVIKRDLYEFELDFEKDFDYSLLDQYAETHSKTDTCIRISEIYQSNIGQTVNIKSAVISFGKLNLEPTNNIGFWMIVNLKSNNETLQCLFTNNFINTLIDKDKLVESIDTKEAIDIMKCFYKKVCGMDGVFSLLIVECDLHQVIGFETDL
jgi:hypothetical protein